MPEPAVTRSSRTDAPTHLIAGGATTPFLLESARALAEVIPGGSLSELPGLDHFAHLVDPVGFAGAVRVALS